MGKIIKQVLFSKLSALLTVLFALSSLSAEWDDFGALTDEEKIYGLSLIWKEVSYNYPHIELLAEIDWDNEYRRYLEKITQTENIYEYYLMLQQFTALLEDCNTRVVFPLGFQTRLDYPLIRLERIGEEIIITNTAEKYAELIPVGSSLLEVEGLPVKEYMKEKVIPFVSASNRAVLTDKALSLMFFGVRDTTVDIIFRYPEDMSTGTPDNVKTGHAKVTRNRDSDRWSMPFGAGEELLFHNWLDDDVLYVSLESFNDEMIIRMFDSILDELTNCKGLIIDLRKNRWGRTTVSNEILKYLTDKSEITGVTIETRKNISLYKAWGTPIFHYSYLPPEEYIQYGEGDAWYRKDSSKIINDRSGEKILVPLVVLIGSKTASAAEDFLASLLTAREDIVLIGSHTSGSRGQALVLTLPGNGHVWINTTREIYNDETVLSRNGIKPDIEVEKTYQDYLSNDDPVLERGYREIKNMIGLE